MTDLDKALARVPYFQELDAASISLLSKVWRGGCATLHIVQPETVVR